MREKLYRTEAHHDSCFKKEQWEPFMVLGRTENVRVQLVVLDEAA
jgi:hypothetical protein